MKLPVHRESRRIAAFSLVELLTVVAIMAVLMALSGVALQSVKSSGDVNKAIVETAHTLEYARIYAMSNHTFVRVAIGQSIASSLNSTPATVLVAIYSVDGTLDADTASSMADPAKWKPLVKPIVLNNLSVSKNLTVTMNLDAASYASPDQTDIPSPVSFKIGGRGAVSCSSFIQFNPNGEARVLRGEPARFIDLAIDGSGVQGGRNPFVIRLSGLSGCIDILRKGEGIQ